MTVPTQTNKAIFTANGVTTEFPFTFGTLPTADLVVTLIDGDTETVVNPSDYTVRGAGRDDGGSVVFNDPPASGLNVLIQRLVPYTQPTDYKNQGSFYPRTHERSFDRATMQMQQLAEEVGRSLRLPPSSQGINLTLPAPMPLAALVWSTDGTRLENGDPDRAGDMLLRPDLGQAAPGKGASLVGFLQDGARAVARTAQDKLRERATVQDFGAKGDGSTDDTAAFEAALQAAQLVVVPRGTYRVAGVVLPPAGAKIIGDGAVLRPAVGTTEQAMFIASSEVAASTEFNGLRFDGRASEMAGNMIQAIRISGNKRVTIRGCVFTNFTNRVVVVNEGSDFAQIVDNRFHDTGTTTNCNCIEMRANDALIANNHFLNVGDGHCIRLGGSGAGALRTNIIGNVVKDTQHVFVTCELNTHEVNIVGNLVENTEQAVKTENDETNVTDINISGNVFRNIYATTAFNLQTKGVRFNNNKVIGCAGGVYFGSEFQCNDNLFTDSGTTDRAVISQAAASSGGTVVGNTIVNPGFEGIRVSGDSTVTGNRIKNVPTLQCAIHVQGTGNVVTGNLITNAPYAFRLAGNTANCVIESNSLVTVMAPILASTAARQGANFRTNRIGYNNGDATNNTAAPTEIIDKGTIYVNEGTSHVFVDTEASAATDDLDNILGGYSGQRITLSIVSSARDVNLRSGVGGNIILRLSTGYGTPATLGSIRSSITLHNQSGTWVELDRAIIG